MKLIVYAALVAAAIVPCVAHADSFMPPALAVTPSVSGSAVVTVIPAALACAAGERDCEPAARAIVELVQGSFRIGSTTIRLVNPEAPGLALVTDDGERLLTVDDYAGAGFGPNVLVVYRRDGSVVRQLSLADFLPEDYVNGLPRTVSTLRWWGDAPVIEPGSHRAIISLNLVVPEGQEFRGRQSLPLALDLDSGELEKPTGAEWQRALNCARANAWLVPDRKALRERARFKRLCG